MTDIFLFVAAVLVPLAVGFLGSLATMDGVRTWYPTLVKPPYSWS